jgi:hypothetical protein
MLLSCDTEPWETWRMFCPAVIGHAYSKEVSP